MDEFFKTWIPNVMAYKNRFLDSLGQTFEMTVKSGLIAFAIGLALGVLLTVTKKNGIRPQPVVYRVIDLIGHRWRSGRHPGRRVRRRVRRFGLAEHH